MALLFIEGFDHYGTTVSHLTRKWNSIQNSGQSFQTGRLSGRCLRHTNGNDHIDKTLPASYGTIVIGFAYKTDALPSSATKPIFTFKDTGSNQSGIGLTTSGQLMAFRDTISNVIATSSNSLLTTTWYYIEAKVVFGNTGSFEIKVNGTNSGWVNASSVDTTTTGNNTANEIRITGGDPLTLISNFDDLYVLDTTGSANNNFLGDVRIQTFLPDGNGTTNNFTASAGSNFQNVDEDPADDDTTYNYSSTAGHIDLYNITNLTGSPTIYGVQTNLCSRKTDAGARTIKRKCKSGATTSNGSAVSPSTTYAYFSDILEQDPNTAAAWTATNLNAAEFGLEIDT